jgi:hypothetical protein
VLSSALMSMTMRGSAAALVFACVGAFAVACGSAGPSTPNNDYVEYSCPEPIGNIVRETCDKSAIHYDGLNLSGAFGVEGVGVSAEYRVVAIREAELLVQMLKAQRVALCENFNTCKLTLGQYREDQRTIDDSFIALLAIKDRVVLDAEGAAKVLVQLKSIRAGAQEGAVGVKPPATDTPTDQASSSIPDNSVCAGRTSILVFERDGRGGGQLSVRSDPRSAEGSPGARGDRVLRVVSRV